jgi:hypothetical protein
MMQESNIQLLKYPIGVFEKPQEVTEAILATWVKDIIDLPQQLRQAVANLTEEQLEIPYRPDGWTVRQTVHHVADSHINAYIRFKLALTESTPTIKPYEEGLWAELPDGKNAPIEWSLELLEMLHKRWGMLLENLSEREYAKKFYHPATRHENSLKIITGMYSWHGRHHVAHINTLRKRMDW